MVEIIPAPHTLVTLAIIAFAFSVNPFTSNLKVGEGVGSVAFDDSESELSSEHTTRFISIRNTLIVLHWR